MPSPRRRTRAAAATVLTTALLSSVWTGGVAGAAGTPPNAPGGSLGSAVGGVNPGPVRPAAASGRVPAATPVAPPALYGKSDPSADGVYRQSLAILALASAGARPAPQAVQWLLAQQCADGGFTAFRADPAAPCDVAREDTSATATAVQALVALRTYGTQAGRGAEWLRSKQLPDGSFATLPGAPGAVGDPNSTAFAINALVATGVNPDTLRTAQGRTPADALKAMQVVCPAPPEALGAFRGPFGGAGDPLVTARATLGLAYNKLPTVPVASIAVTPFECPGPGTAPTRQSAAQAGAAWLVGALKAGGNHLGGSADFDATAAAVSALVATGHPAEAGAAVDWLAAGAKTMAGNDPVRLASLILAAEATGRTLTTFGGLDLLGLLTATGPASTPTPDMANQSNTSNGPADHTLRDTISAVIAVLLGATLIVGMRRSRREP